MLFILRATRSPSSPSLSSSSCLKSQPPRFAVTSPTPTCFPKCLTHFSLPLLSPQQLNDTILASLGPASGAIHSPFPLRTSSPRRSGLRCAGKCAQRRAGAAGSLQVLLAISREDLSESLMGHCQLNFFLIHKKTPCAGKTCYRQAHLPGVHSPAPSDRHSFLCECSCGEHSRDFYLK